MDVRFRIAESVSHGGIDRAFRVRRIVEIAMSVTKISEHGRMVGMW